MEKIIYTKFSNNRAKYFGIQTDIYEDESGRRVVKKKADCDEALPHVRAIEKHMGELSKAFSDSILEPNRCQLKGDILEIEYINGTSLEKLICEKIKERDEKEIEHILKNYSDLMRKVYGKELFEKSDEFCSVFGDVKFEQKLPGGKNIDIDLIFSNIIIQKDKWIVLDYEWTFDFLIPVDFVIYRAIYYLSLANPNLQKLMKENLYKICGINENLLPVLAEMEEGFQNYVKAGEKTYHDEMNELNLKQNIDISEKIYVKCQLYWNLGEGYREEESCIKQRYLKKNGTIEIKEKVPDNTKEIGIRLSQFNCIAEVLKLVAISKSKEEVVLTYTTLVESKGGYVWFDNNDPVIFISDFPDESEEIYIEYKIWRLDSDIVKIISNERKNSRDEQIRCEKERRCFEEEKELLNKELVEYNQQMEDYRKQLENMKSEKELLTQKYSELQKLIVAIYSSKSWKLTRPIRKVKNKLRYWKGCLERGGLTEETRYVEIQPNGSRLERNERNYIDIGELDAVNKKIAVHIHLYYVDLLDEFASYLKNIPYTYDLFVSCREGEDVQKIKKILCKLPRVNRVVVVAGRNRGRDIAPLYVEFGKEIVTYDYFLHVHSKKSLYTGEERRGWRQYSLDSLLGSPEMIKKIFYLFENDKAGLIYPDNHEEVPMNAYHWLNNETRGRQLLKQFGIEFQQGIFMYPAGSFFWCKTEAVRQLFEAGFSWEDFEEEAGQTDGTLAHALERVIAFVCEKNGYRQEILDYKEGIVRQHFSVKPFRNYLAYNVDELCNQLANYNVISFDIFDTLVTRKIHNPDDLFKIMQTIIKDKFSLEVDFLEKRKKAEALANIEFNAYTNIDNIYEKLSEVMDITTSQSEEIKQIEISLEKALICPREDMLKVFEKLKKMGKHIILVSDMYLTREIVCDLLETCGFLGYEKIFLSCEIGLRKDTDSIWEEIFKEYDKSSFIHVGDNLRSDWQTLADRKVASLWLMNASDLATVDSRGDYKQFEIKGTGNSVTLGLILNKKIYNSPFALCEDGYCTINSAKEYGYTIFGPLFYEFTKWIMEKVDSETKLLFLAREGYLLSKIYKIICEGEKKAEVENHYLLISRRAITVAGIREWEDVRNIIARSFKGPLSKLMRNRFGIELMEEIEDIDLEYYDNSDTIIEDIMTRILPMKGVIYQRAEEERSCYLCYLKGIVKEEDWDKITVVDVGYAGTIQLFLAKLLQRKINGLYFASFGEFKPKQIGCPGEAMYNKEYSFTNEIMRTQLFLEAVLRAPFGQLLHFERVDDASVKPVYKADTELPQELVQLQEGILQYCKERAELNAKMEIKEDGIEAMERIYKIFICGHHMGSGYEKIFEVEDDYCSNKVLAYDKSCDAWV